VTRAGHLGRNDDDALGQEWAALHCGDAWCRGANERDINLRLDQVSDKAIGPGLQKAQLNVQPLLAWLRHERRDRRGKGSRLS